MSVNGMRQVVEEVGSSTVDQSICLMADIKLAKFALLKSGLSNTLIAGFNFGDNKGADIGMFVSTVKHTMIRNKSITYIN